MPNKRSKVIVGMSGGVDSSVSANLLQKNPQLIVEGLFMLNWDSAINNDILGHKNVSQECSGAQDWSDVQKVATSLDIKVHRVNFVKAYWDNVFEYFLASYKEGFTPNPDVLCNQMIKFDAFLKYAREHLKADYVAMGHYAQVLFNNEIQEYQLLRAADSNKDQTYFLSRLTQDQLQYIKFPVGGLQKQAVRRIAREHNLVVADKKDSTGICFIGERNFTAFLQNYLPNQPGPIIDITNQSVQGQHIGTMYFTIGQRKKLNLGGKREPYYIVGKNIKAKIIYVAPKSQKDQYLRSNSAIITKVNFINTNIPKVFAASVKFRYRQPDIPVQVKVLSPGKIHLTYDKALAVTPGQEAVLYNGNVCLGGGEINKVFWNNHLLEHL